MNDASFEIKMARKRKRIDAGNEVDSKLTEDLDNNGPTVISQNEWALEELRCHMRLYELSDRFMMLELKTIASREVEDELQRCNMNNCMVRYSHLNMSDITTILADVQLHTISHDTELRPEVLSFCISNCGACPKMVAHAVEESIRATDPLYWDFGMRVAKQLKEWHEVYMSDVKNKVQE